MTPLRSRKAVITGILGQDGWYLASYLLRLGYEVVGTTHRRDAVQSLQFDARQAPVIYLDLQSPAEIEQLISEQQADEFYNLAARASSAQHFDNPLETARVNGVAVGLLLEAIRQHSPKTRFCQASTSEIFGGASQSPQDELSPKAPLNPYGASKAFADHLVSAYRHSHGLFACSAILYSHESPRRSPHFLVRKVTQAVARIQAGLQERVTLGDLNAVRDWGYAPDYMDGMYRMLQTESASDFVFATGTAHSVRDVCEIAFCHLGLDWQRYVSLDEALRRRPEHVHKVGNANRALAALGWAPSCSFQDLITRLVDADVELLNADVRPRSA